MHHPLTLLSDCRPLLSLLHWELVLVSFLLQYRHAEVFHKDLITVLVSVRIKEFNVPKLSQH